MLKLRNSLVGAAAVALAAATTPLHAKDLTLCWAAWDPANALVDQNHLHLDVGGHSLVTLADPHERWKPGDALSIELLDPTYFDAAGRRIAA